MLNQIAIGWSISPSCEAAYRATPDHYRRVASAEPTARPGCHIGLLAGIRGSDRQTLRSTRDRGSRNRIEEMRWFDPKCTGKLNNIE